MSDNLMMIGSYAFSDCSSLANMMIPDSVASISFRAFYGCTSLTNVVFEGDAPLVYSLAFGRVSTNCTVYVNIGSSGWGVRIPGKWQGMYIKYLDIGDFSEVLGGEWEKGIEGVADVKGYGDETAEVGVSVKFTAEDSSLVWIETEVTNSCRVAFRWKASCEPLVKGSPYDYLSFEVDGEEKWFICGETGWEEKSVELLGDGIHRLRWCFQRDDEGEGGENSAWLAD
jgi:hypothetical protein